MRKVEIKDSNGKMVFVEVSEEVYAILQEENKEQEQIGRASCRERV